MIMQIYGGNLMKNNKETAECFDVKEMAEIFDKLPMEQKKVLIRLLYYKMFLGWLNDN